MRIMRLGNIQHFLVSLRLDSIVQAVRKSPTVVEELVISPLVVHPIHNFPCLLFNMGLVGKGFDRTKKLKASCLCGPLERSTATVIELKIFNAVIILFLGDIKIEPQVIHQGHPIKMMGSVDPNKIIAAIDDSQIRGVDYDKTCNQSIMRRPFESNPLDVCL